MGSVQKSHKKKSEKKAKRKMVDEDEEYKPSEIEEETCSSSEEERSDDEMFSGSQKGKAIALSLKDSGGFLDVPTNVPSQSSGAHAVDGIGNQKERNPNIQEDVEKRKRKKMGKQINSRVQMTLDEMVIHFFHFDDCNWAFLKAVFGVYGNWSTKFKFVEKSVQTEPQSQDRFT